MNEIIESKAQNKLLNKIMNVNKQHETEIYSLITSYIDEELNERDQRLMEIINDNNIKLEKRHDKKLEKINSKLTCVENQSNIVYKRTNTLSFTGKAKELSDKVKSVSFKHTGNKGSLEYILFYSKFINQIYKKLKDYYDVNSYTMIDSDSFDECIKTVSRWNPKHNAKREIVKEYQKLDDKGRLTDIKSRALSQYIDEKEGNI